MEDLKKSIRCIIGEDFDIKPAVSILRKVEAEYPKTLIIECIEQNSDFFKYLLGSHKIKRDRQIYIANTIRKNLRENGVNKKTIQEDNKIKQATMIEEVQKVRIVKNKRERRISISEKMRMKANEEDTNDDIN